MVQNSLTTRYKMSQYRTGSGVAERANKRVSTVERVNKASSVEKVVHKNERVDEQADEQVANHLRPDWCSGFS